MPWHFGKSVFLFPRAIFSGSFQIYCRSHSRLWAGNTICGKQSTLFMSFGFFLKDSRNIHKSRDSVLSKHWILQEQSLQCTCCWGLLRFVWCQPPPPPPGLDWTRTNFIAVSDPAKTGAESAFVNWGKLFFAAESFQHFFFKSGGKIGQSSNKLHPCAELSYIIFNIYSW